MEKKVAIKLLLIDDEPDILDISKQFLELDRSISVDTTISAADALHLMRLQEYDVVVSDYQMPGEDGIQLLKEIRATGNKIPFILFTGRGREEIAIEAFENGADAYVQKGGETKTQFAELMRKINRAVDLRQPDKEGIAHTRLYSAVLSESNRAIVRIHDKKELLNEICRINVDIGGFSMVWAGIVNPEKQLIEPIVSYGQNEEHLDTIAVSVEDEPRGRGPTGTAFRDRKFVVCKDIANDPMMEPWREEASRRGFRSLATFPFALNTKDAGVITHYSSESGFFTDEIIRLLGEQSDDLTRALASLEREEQRLSAEKDLERSELQYRRLFETAQDGILILDYGSGKIIDANKAILDLTGYLPDEVSGKSLWDLGFIEDRSLVDEAFSQLRTKGYVLYENIPLRMKNGETMLVEFVSNVYMAGENKIVQCNIREVSERRLNDEKIIELARIVNSTDDAIIGKDLNGIITSWNKGAERIYGYTSIEIVGRSGSLLDVPDSQDDIREILTRVSTGELITDLETSRLAKGGKQISVSLTISPVLDDQGNVIGSSTIARNITERKLAENELRDSRERFRTYLENSPEGIFVVDAKGNFQDVNGTACSMLGYSSAELLDLDLKDILDGSQAQGMDKFQILKEKGSVTLETVIVRKDGARIPVFLNAVELPNQRYMAYCTDITERKRAEAEINKNNEALKVAYAQLSAVAEELRTAQLQLAVAMGLVNLVDWEMDLARNLFIFNDRFYALYGTSAEREGGYFLTPETYTETFVHPDDRVTIARVIEQNLTSEEGLAQVEHRIVRRDGQVRDIMACIKVERDENGRPVRIYGANQDITERKRTEEALQQASKKLNLLSSITRHDINNQIMVLMGNLELLEKIERDSSNTHLLKAEAATERISAIIKFTKTYEDIGVHAPTWQNVRTLVETSVRNAPPEHIKVANDIPDGIEVFADPLIMNVFNNLIDNAVRHGGKVSTIRFYIGEHDGVRAIVYEDDGSGIEEDMRERLFTRGFGKNNGLGLFLSREIVSITGITIREAGEPGKGAKFVMTVPPNGIRGMSHRTDP